MTTKTLYATSLFLLIAGLISVNGITPTTSKIQNSKLETCLDAKGSITGTPITQSVFYFDCKLNLIMT